MPASRPHCLRAASTLLALLLTIVVSAAHAEGNERRSLAAAASDTVKTAAANVLQTAEDLSVFALGLIGVNYRYGGDSPDTGLDCSGLVRYVFQQVTGVSLPHNAKQMSRVGAKVSVKDLKPGDLVFFNTRRFAFSHVGIYLGDNRFLHSPAQGREVEIATLDTSYWQKRFNGARRLVGVLPGLVPALVPALVSEAVAAPLPTPAPAPPSNATATIPTDDASTP